MDKTGGHNDSCKVWIVDFDTVYYFIMDWTAYNDYAAPTVRDDHKEYGCRFVLRAGNFISNRVIFHSNVVLILTSVRSSDL